ncbi:unnamed protein product [Linum tenue]|uniref:BHLH domain-containing protein n=2 Tax=Linum tenue TaxID=586396 RepID=A0AAV0KEU1_9ROSI|nr:unnamed protein product [Linum tenue]
MLQDKRPSPRSFLTPPPTSSSAAKRLKPDAAMSRDRKDKQLGEKIVALQQLVSPYGKTDTASVLQEAMDYISFLHDQLKVLSAPYLLSAASAAAGPGLRGRGLCLVPVAATAAIDRTNGADLWAPTKTAPSASPRIEKLPHQPPISAYQFLGR